MGVQGLWTLLSPAARPIQLESLRDRKLAIDASIWIHQFMRTMRSEDGSVLRNGHVLGFFRRLCKLLFYNIKPVFVFDGGAPTLKRSTIRERRQRRQGIQENVKRTAEKILNAQMKAHFLMEEEKRRKAIAQSGNSTTINNKDDDDDDDENYVYLEQLDNTAALDTLRHQNTIKQDQYQLPPLMTTGEYQKKDPRLATNQELLDFIEEFKPSDINMDSNVFQQLPTEIQYEIIQDLKLKSRQTSWARLDNMVRQSKTPLDFSKQQILQLKHRNEMTQRVLQMNDMASMSNDTATPSRIASERGKAYVLLKNENLEEGLGWKLPGLGNKTSTATVTKQESIQNMDDDIDMDLKDEKTVENVLSPSSLEMEDDPVAKAVASNPALAAMMGNFENELKDENEYATNDNVIESTPYDQYDDNDIYQQSFDDLDDSAPLFINNGQEGNISEDDDQLSSDYLDDFGQYGQQDEVHLNQILLKMYNENHEQQLRQQRTVESLTGVISEHNDELDNSHDDVFDTMMELDADNFYQLWLSRVPDAFIYMYSLNDEYKTILKNVISDTTSISDLEQQLKSVQKAFGKSNDSDTMAHESLTFHENLLRHALIWKRKKTEEGSTIATTQQETSTDSMSDVNNGLIVLDDDDDDDDDIQLVDNADDWKQHQQQSQLELQHQNKKETHENTTIHVSSPSSTHMARLTEDPMKIDRTILASTILNDTAPHESKLQPLDVNQKDRHDHEEEAMVVDNVGNHVDKRHEMEDLTTLDIIQHDDYQSTMAADNQPEETNQEAMMDIGYNSDEELTGNVEEEEAEFARFVSDIASRDISSVRQELADDVHQLNKQQSKAMGNADSVTEQMVKDIQELLQLFGVPYIVSPMEAEAQCAFLLDHDLVDGVVTDDSDVFLFGGSRVYKNMFHQQKYVECYLLQDIDREMRLDRQKLIQLAYFLGSDYTPGLPGIGPVVAMEILAAFQQDKDQEDSSLEGPLIRFKEWYESGLDESDFQRKFRKKHKHLDIPADFPNPLIKEAYYHPMVDTSLERFSWSPPQLDSLRLYLMKSFSWSEEKTDQVLIPVIREMNNRKATGQQTTISNYFDASAGLSSSYSAPRHQRKHKSKRIQQVVNQLKKKKAERMTSELDSSDSDNDTKVVKKPKQKRTA
ncbi:uncharacterized protein BX664DRAFT_338768 [Halteromyces radiatus]|uniref:uncharacterized protein n=1 Tax=Halteromyces radiatus TaxID=101107 RepID=UPI00221EF8C8|nr:uncharacterized protein BX664DRAFT_338768 [Halteromyces radiatus]KAI8085190.1 hypothetical protein BX664DRAFT_338768 [Halteromyces radiatus]